MKQHRSPRSPFVRKVMIVAHETGLVDRIECVRSVVASTQPHAELVLIERRPFDLLEDLCQVDR